MALRSTRAGLSVFHGCKGYEAVLKPKAKTAAYSAPTLIRPTQSHFYKDALNEYNPDRRGFGPAFGRWRFLGTWPLLVG
jgi:hypothetical protein